MQLPPLPIDGNWVDIGSLITGLVYILIQKIRSRRPSRLISKQTGFDFANGAALFPLIVMSGCVLSSGLIKGLVEASKISLSIAGFFALLAILEDSGNDGNGPSMFR